MVTDSDVRAAARRIAGHVRRTPVLEADLGFGPVVLKLEQLQHTGSFKARGALSLVLARRPRAGVVAASGGNHGLAVAFAAREVGTPATVYVPTSSPAIKVAGIRALGAEVVVGGDFYAAAYAAALARSKRTGELLVHAYDAPEVVAGQGTVGAELAEQVPELDTVLVAVGGGGLVGGIAAALAPRGVRVVGVEPERAPTLHAALAAGRPVDVEVGGVAADSLGAGRIGELGFAAALTAGVRSVLVPDAAILDARRRLWERARVVAEAGGATALAALVCGAYRPEPGERVAVVVCGANTDPHDLVARS